MSAGCAAPARRCRGEQRPRFDLWGGWDWESQARHRPASSPSLVLCAAEARTVDPSFPTRMAFCAPVSPVGGFISTGRALVAPVFDNPALLAYRAAQMDWPRLQLQAAMAVPSATGAQRPSKAAKGSSRLDNRPQPSIARNALRCALDTPDHRYGRLSLKPDKASWLMMKGD